MELISFVLLLTAIGALLYFLFGKRSKNLPPGKLQFAILKEYRFDGI